MYFNGPAPLKAFGSVITFNVACKDQRASQENPVDIKEWILLLNVCAICTSSLNVNIYGNEF